MQDIYPVMSGVYQVTLDETDHKLIYKSINNISEEIKADYESNNPFSSLQSLFYSDNAEDTVDELYLNTIENVVIHDNDDGQTIITFHWHSGSDSLEEVGSYFANRIQEEYDPAGTVAMRTYTEQEDGEYSFTAGSLIDGDYTIAGDYYA